MKIKRTYKDYNDILFYVEADPSYAIYDPEKPVIPDPEPKPEIKEEQQVATLAFEDIWPDGGDYDMNDVIVEHTRIVSVNQDNYVVKVVDKFKMTNEGADYVVAFGFAVDSKYAGTIDSESKFAVKEENNQFIMFEDVHAVGAEDEFVVVRTFAVKTVSKNGFDDGFNPFIVSQYVAGAKGRTETHLPKCSPTSWADASQAEGASLYYIDTEGKYPFAIRLENVTGWEPVTESSRIGSTGEYPRYDNWVESGGKADADWYLTKTK